MNRAKKKEKLFSFQKLNKYFFLPFFVPIICFTTKFFSETMKTDGSKKNISEVTEDNVNTFAFLYQLIQSICLILGGLLYFVSKYISKTKIDEINNDNLLEKTNSFTEKNIQNLNNLDTSSNKSKQQNKSKIKDNLIIIFMPLLLIMYNLGIAYGVKYPQLEKRVYFLFFITLINVFFLKKELFKHHKLALVITAIGIIPLFLAFGLFLKVDDYFIIYDISLFIGSFAYSVYLVFIKYLTNNKGISVFLLLLYQGILCTIYTIIIYLFVSLAMKGDLTYLSNIFHCNTENYICISYYYVNIIFYFILNTVLQALIFLVVYYFSPELFAISDIFSPLFSFIAACIENNETRWLKIFLTCLGYLIIAVGAFIYNELIVCNFCGFNENTWKAIDKKAEDDYLGKNSRDSFVIYDGYEIKLHGEIPNTNIEMTEKKENKNNESNDK